MNFETLYVNPKGRTPRGQYIGAVLTLLAAAALYLSLVRNITGYYCLIVLVFPAMVLHARRLHDMGQTGWLVLAPGALDIAALALHIARADGQLKGMLTLAAFAVSAGFVVWGLVGKGQPAANRFGDPAAA